MGITTLYYFLAFIFFIACIIGIQKWVKLSQQKKDTIGLIVLSIFLITLFTFIGTISFKPNYLGADTIMFIGIGLIFLLIVFTAFTLKWYNDKYHREVNIGSIIIVMGLTIFGIAFLVLKSQGKDEKERIVKKVLLQTVVTNITFDNHKPYFKDMALADGQFLPMPEEMNTTLQIGDSIYKMTGEHFYRVINYKTKLSTKYTVTTHIRVLGKPQ